MSAVAVMAPERHGAPSRAAILTALAAAAMHGGDLKGVLTLARTGRPRSLYGAGGQGRHRWLALHALRCLYPSADGEVLAAALGCRASNDRRQHEPSRARSLAAIRDWDPQAIYAVARATADHEDAHLTASWVWPVACEVAAAWAGAEARTVATPPGPGASARAVSSARRVAIYLTMIEGDVNATALAAASGLDKKSVREAVGAVEDRRDEDAALDAALTDLGARLRARLDEELKAW